MTDTTRGDIPSVKVKAYFDPATAPEDIGGGESFWATPMLDHPATTATHTAMRVDNALIFAPFTLGDIVLVTPNDENILQVVALLERSPQITIAVLLESTEKDNPVAEAAIGVAMGQLVTALDAAGASIERLTGSLSLAQLPDTVTSDGIDSWLYAALESVPPAALDNTDLSIDLIHHPDAPLVVEWLDTSLQQMPPGERYDGDPEAAWDPNTPAFRVAITEAREAEHIPAWVDDDTLMRVASQLWWNDSRVRAAVQADNLWGVAVFAFRISAPAGTIFLPLGKPLL